MMEFIKLYFPVWVKTVKRGKMVFDPDIAADILYADFTKKYLVPHNGIFPSFKEKNKEGETVEVTKTFIFDILNPVAEGTNGQAFGELALINDKPRSATIIWLEDTHFAILEKDDFKKIMEKSIRSKFSSKVQFLSGFPFLAGMTRIAKTKLWYIMKEQKYIAGQKVILEGDDLKHVYLIEKGEFEVHKAVYLKSNRNLTYGHYLRVNSSYKFDSFKKMLNEESKIVFSNEKYELDNFKSKTSLMQKQNLKISLLGKSECFGIAECLFGCPYSIISVTCSSREGVIQKIDISDFKSKIKAHFNSVQKVVKHKLSFFIQRLLSLFEIKDILIPDEYKDILEDAKFDSEYDKDSGDDKESNIDDSIEKSNTEIAKDENYK